MNCWNILGIAQTSDLTAIKTAYAAKAKECHPEEHPEEFQRLQQAYRSASRWAKVQKNIVSQKEVVENKAAVEAVTKASLERENFEKETALIRENKAITEKSKSNRENEVILDENELYTETIVNTEKIDPDRENKVIAEKNRSDRECAVIAENSKSDREPAVIAEESEPNREPAVIVEQESPVKETAVGMDELESTISPERKEDISELSWKFDYGDIGDIGEIPQDFDYDVVEEVDLKDQFFKEFFSIAWNPYLMNNLDCWEYLLKRAPYEQLLASQAFRNNFVRTVSYQLLGWQRKTILFFERWLETYPARDREEKQKKETEFFCWRYNRLGLFSKFVPIQRCVTNDQKQLHEFFLSQVKKCGRDTRLSSAEDVECYLSYYLPYAIAKPEKIKELYQGSCQGRTFMLGLMMMVPIIIGMVVYVQVSVVPQMDEKTEKEIEQRRIEQIADEIKEYNQLTGDSDSNIEVWMQQQIELRREFLEKNADLIGEYYEQFPDNDVIAEMIAEMEELGIGNSDDMTTAEEE